MKINNNKWDKIIDSKKSKFIFNLYEIIQYKDLIKFFIDALSSEG